MTTLVVGASSTMLLNLGLFFWRAEDALVPLQLARKHIPNLPDDFGAFVAGLSAPPAPFVAAEHHGIPGVAVIITNWDAANDHADAIAPLRALDPLFELVTSLPHTALQQMFDESAPWGIHAYEKALYLDDLTDEVVTALTSALPGRASPMSFVPIFPLGGHYARVPDQDTAFGGRRSTRWALNLAAIAPDADLLASDRTWVRNLRDQLRPHASDAGGYINFLADDDTDRVKAAYGPKYTRLAATKTIWDPDNVLHHNANIHPSGLTAKAPTGTEPASLLGPARATSRPGSRASSAWAS